MFAFRVKYTEEFEKWFADCPEKTKGSVLIGLEKLRDFGFDLGFPHSSAIHGARHGIRELRLKDSRGPIRIFYAWDPERSCIILCGGHKHADKRFYSRMIARAEAAYERYLESLG